MLLVFFCFWRGRRGNGIVADVFVLEIFVVSVIVVVLLLLLSFWSCLSLLKGCSGCLILLWKS